MPPLAQLLPRDHHPVKIKSQLSMRKSPASQKSIEMRWRGTTLDDGNGHISHMLVPNFKRDIGGLDP
jgi:hypothetical protein